MTVGQLVLDVHLLCTLAMVGLIWFVQVVHYPLYQHVGERAFRSYHHAHVRRTTAVVMAPMLGEALTGVYLMARPPESWSLQLNVTLALLLGVVWCSTAVLQIPQHGKLEEGFNADAARRLVGTNWIRTMAWSLRGILLLIGQHGVL